MKISCKINNLACKLEKMMENKSAGSDGALNAFWKLFTSLKLTITLLLTLAITSVIGTVLPQNEDPAAYRHAFGDTIYSVFDFLGLFDMYHSWWFLLLMFLVVINIVVCSIDRLRATWKTIFPKERKFNLASFRSAKNRTEFKVHRNAEVMVPAIKAYLSKHYSHLTQESGESGPVFFAEKWRWSRLGVYVVHLSIIFLLIGAIIGSIFGFDGYVNIPEGESTGTIRLIGSGETHELEFTIRCNDFDVSFYETGMPKEFRSSLTILEGNSEILTRDIVVNDPLRFRGINIFQSSYGEMPAAGSATLDVTSKETSQTYSLEAGIGQTVQLPENLGILQLRELRSSYNFEGNDLGTTLIGTLVQKDGNRVNIILPVNFPTFDRMVQRLDPARSDTVTITLKGLKSDMADSQSRRYFTGLQVTKDPGVGVVYAGFVLLLSGCAIAFFMSYQQVCVEVTPLKNNTRIAVSGKTMKGKPGIGRQVDEISKKLQSISKRTAKKDKS